MRHTIISFSGRSGGNCSRIAAELCRTLSGEITLFDFATFTISPCGRCGCECFQARERCPYFDDPEFALCGAVTSSERAWFVVPNYCDYPCSNFFIFNERSQCFFQHHEKLLACYLAVPKRFIAISNTGRENFTAAFRYHVAEGVEPEVLFLSAKAFQKSSLQGDLMDSPAARAVLADFLQT